MTDEPFYAPNPARRHRRGSHNPANGCSSFAEGTIDSCASCATTARTGLRLSSWRTKSSRTAGGSTRARLAVQWAEEERKAIEKGGD